jgi:membrane-associated phospholipid phosphatase
MAQLALLVMVLGLASPLGGQSARDSAQKTFFVKGDLVTAGAIVGASALTAVFDQRISNWWQSPRVQGDASRSDRVEALTFVNETPLTIAAVAAYGIGRLAHNETLADIGLHTAEAVVLSVGMAEVVRTTLGRYRPRESPDDPFRFKFGAGFTQFGARSYPSVHADAAFAVASVLAGELRMRAPTTARYTTPLLYTAALVPGITRMYLNQHWASDIVAGSLMGVVLGSRVVTYAHSHQRNKLDRVLLGVAAQPDAHGGVMLTARLLTP